MKYFTKKFRQKGEWKYSVLEFYDSITFLIFIIGIAGAIRFFVFMPYTIEGDSMKDTFHNKDFIIVDKISSKIKPLQRGDVVVFIPEGKDIPFIKRIIGLPGDTVKISEGKTSICTGTGSTEQCRILDESYLSAGVQTEPRCGVSSFTITDGYFVMGDNRGYSTDSRCCFGLGCVEGTTYTVAKDRIIGTIFMRLFPRPGISTAVTHKPQSL